MRYTASMSTQLDIEMDLFSDTSFEVEMICGRWIFSEVELALSGERPVQMTVGYPCELDVDEADDLIDEAINKCLDERENLANSEACTFDAQAFIAQELMPFGMHVMPSRPEMWGTHLIRPSMRLQ